jgi:GT2 family glycosyltransferase
MDGRAAPSLTVVVPAFDEAHHVRANLHAIARALVSSRRSFEILLVDDGSQDRTAAEADLAAAEDPRIRVLRHVENRGKGAALATGCAAATGDVLVFLDADLEISPDEVLPMLARMEAERADVAVGSKYLPGSSESRPLHRVLLSRLYRVATSVLFRLPLRDTQTGLKAMRRDLARAVVPAIRTTRWAWDVELLVLAHRLGARIVSSPVRVDFRRRSVRIGGRGFLDSGLDTVGVFLRDRCLGAYGRPLRAARGRTAPRRETRVCVTADDLGMSAGVDRGIVEAAREGRALGASLLADGATAASGAAALCAQAPQAEVGVHVDLAGERLAGFLARAASGVESSEAIRARVRRQIETARGLGVAPERVDAHRHAFFPPAAYRAVAAEARASCVGAIRRPVPIGSLRCGAGRAGIAKGALLWAAGLFTRGVPRAYGLRAPDGVVDARVAASWVRAGRLPIAVRGKAFEVVAHPADGVDDVPACERGLDRAGDAAALVGLIAGLEALGARPARFADLRLPRAIR